LLAGSYAKAVRWRSYLMSEVVCRSTRKAKSSVMLKSKSTFSSSIIIIVRPGFGINVEPARRPAYVLFSGVIPRPWDF
jgi:hypothetical protein